jgi:hypothetical protein
MTLRLRSMVSAMSLGFFVTLTSAQQPADTLPPPVPQGVDIFNFGEFDKTCTIWTDGCRNCSRGTGSSPNCGNIGIACQPQDKVTCSSRAPESSKSEETKQ